MPDTLPESSLVDFQVEDHGSILLLRPLNEDLKNHLKENVSAESQWFAGALVVEPRYILPLVEQLESIGYSSGIYPFLP